MKTFEDVKIFFLDLGFDDSELNPQKKIISDLGCDSTERISLRAKIVKKFNVDVSFDNCMSIQELVDLINKPRHVKN